MSLGDQASPQVQLRPLLLVEALAELRVGLEAAARELDGFQATVLDLVRRAGASQDASLIEDAQRIDPLVQRLRRLVAGTGDIIAAVEAGGGADLGLALEAASLRGMAPSAAAVGGEGDCDLF